VVVFCESRSFFRLPLKVGERCVSMVFSFLSVFFGQSSMHLPAGSLGLSWWGGGWGAPRRFLCTCVLCILVLNLEGWQIFGGATQIDSEYSAFLEAFGGVRFGEE